MLSDKPFYSFVRSRSWFVITGGMKWSQVLWSESLAWGRKGHTEMPEADCAGWCREPAAHCLQPAPSCTSKAETLRNHCIASQPLLSLGSWAWQNMPYIWPSKGLAAKLVRSVRVRLSLASGRQLLPLQIHGSEAGTYYTTWLKKQQCLKSKLSHYCLIFLSCFSGHSSQSNNSTLPEFMINVLEIDLQVAFHFTHK